MKEFNSKKIMSKLNHDIEIGEAKKMRNKIAEKFPEIKDYSVKYNAKTNGFSFTGFTVEQGQQVENWLKSL